MMHPPPLPVPKRRLVAVLSTLHYLKFLTRLKELSLLLNKTFDLKTFDQIYHLNVLFIGKPWIRWNYSPSFDAYVQDKDIDKRFNMTFLKRKNNCPQIRKFIWKEKSLKSLF